MPVPDALYVTNDWAEFCYRRWGTKWLPLSMDVVAADETLVYRFDTAWTPPLAFFKRAAMEFPLLAFDHAWAELDSEGAGRTRFADGAEQESWASADEDAYTFAVERGLVDE